VRRALHDQAFKLRSICSIIRDGRDALFPLKELPFGVAKAFHAKRHERAFVEAQP
jgi:hypothetical protein